MSEDVKKCKVCGRIITDKNNITGLCPKHQKGLNNSAAMAVLVSAGVCIKKYEPKILKKIIRR